MCKRKPDKGFASVEEQISTFYHSPGEAKGYLARVSKNEFTRQEKTSWLFFCPECFFRVMTRAADRVSNLQRAEPGGSSKNLMGSNGSGQGGFYSDEVESDNPHPTRPAPPHPTPVTFRKLLGGKKPY